MGAELGATTSVFPYDERMARYLRATRRSGLAELADQYRSLLVADPECEADPQPYYNIENSRWIESSSLFIQLLYLRWISAPSYLRFELFLYIML